MTKLIVFDLDGVIFDSKENMRLSWNEVNKELNLGIKFNNYFSKIGKPFEKILHELKVNKKNITKAKKIYRSSSINYLNKIKVYPSVISTIRLLKKKNNYKMAIITSKEKYRALKLLKKFNLRFKHVQCPKKGKKGKPDPFLLNDLVKKIKINKKKIFYVGDTLVDYKFAKNSKINFIYCKYGYGNVYKKNILKVKNLRQIFKYI